jgi:hypothetical protein
MKTESIKVPLSNRAIIQRINRRLAKNHEKLCKSRGWQAQQNLGDYYLLDRYRKTVINSNVNVQTFARELGVIQEHEILVRWGHAEQVKATARFWKRAIELTKTLNRPP